MTLFQSLCMPENVIFSVHFQASHRAWLRVSSDTKTDAEKLFPVQEQTNILELYFPTKLAVIVQEQFRCEFPWRKIPHSNTIKMIHKFRDSGSVANNKTHTGARLTARTPALVQDIRTRVEQSPRKSTRLLSPEVRISRSSMMRVSHSDLKLFPYKVQILEAQSQANKNQRCEFCQSFSERIDNNPRLLGALLFSDEAYFHFSGHVKK